MARRGRSDVELVEDDALDAPADVAAPDEDAARSRRGSLVVGVGLVAALGVVALVGQSVVDRRQRDVVEAVAAQPGGVDLLTGPATVLWETTEPGWLSAIGLRTPGGLLVGVLHADEGPVEVRALDPATGAEVWRTQVLDGAGRGGPLPPDRAPHSGWCRAGGEADEDVVCLVHDASASWSGEEVTATASTGRLVRLDASDGTVVQDVTEALGVEAAPTSFATVGDLVVTALPGADGSAEVVAVAPDGAVAWRLTGSAADVDPADPWGPMDGVVLSETGDLLVVRDGDGLRLVDASGRTVVSAPSGGTMTMPEVVGGAPALVRYTESGVDVLTATGEVRVDGAPVALTVDDGSVPGLLLSDTDGATSAWDADGTRRWTSDTRMAWGSVLVDGRIHTSYGSTLVTLDARTGERLWEAGDATAAPLTDGRHVLSLETSGGDALVARDPADGREAWRTPLPDGIDHLLSLGGVLVAVGSDGQGGERVVVLG